MKLLVTGAKGFIGRNLVAELKNRPQYEVYATDTDTPTEELNQYICACDFVFHLAGVNRPQNPTEFQTGNVGSIDDLLQQLKAANNRAPILLTSSIQAELENPYGVSKRAGEVLLRAYGQQERVPIYLFRLPNVFGKWCRPNYNSVVATFCHQISHGLPIQINDPEAMLHLVYIDDVIEAMLARLELPQPAATFETVATSYTRRLGEVAEMIYSFRASRENLQIPELSDPLCKKLYSTYLSYLPTDKFSYPLTMHVDARGAFTEFLRTQGYGQVSINVTKPGITKGRHWHHTKNEKFLVVAGQAEVRLRKLDTTEIISYQVSGDKLEVIDIPVGYTHDLTNVGTTDMIAIIWSNEIFDPAHPDTFSLEV